MANGTLLVSHFTGLPSSAPGASLSATGLTYMYVWKEGCPRSLGAE
jgi:hypothetical protein